MLKYSLLSLMLGVALVSAKAAYDSNSKSFSGSGSSSGSYGSGYGGSFSGTYGDAAGGPFPPPFPGFGPGFGGSGFGGAGGFAGPFGFGNPEQFNKILSDYFANLQSHYASLYQHQQQLFNNIKQQVESAQPTGGAGGPNIASASASLGPNGVHQTAEIFPENPNFPNVNTRFASDNTISSGKPGFYGVSTSSFSESSNVNGQETNRRGAVTTVNDNGKITTYKTQT